MKEEQRLFLVQARSAHDVYKLLSANESLPRCHALHYLQMTTELLGKANAWQNGPIKKSHKAFVGFLRNLAANAKAQRQLGYERRANWTNMIRKIAPIADELESLAPALACNGPNPEYPWPPEAPIAAPAEHAFPIWDDLTESSFGRELILLIEHLLAKAEEYL